MDAFRFEGQVRSLSGEGLGVVEGPDGRVYFVPGAWPGDEAIFEVVSLKRRYGFAEIIAIKTLSKDRQDPPCPYQGTGDRSCGGCAWMIGAYSSQLLHKQQRVEHAFSRAGFDLGKIKVQKIWASPLEMGYRNRAQFKSDGQVIGFVAANSHNLVPIEECKILSPKMSKLFGELKATLPRKDWKPGNGFNWNYLECDEDSDFKEVVLNKRRPFRQANELQNQKMLDWLRSKILNARGPVLEAFCGSGNLSSVIVEAGLKLVAVEGVSVAVEQLKEKFSSEQVEAICCDLFKHGDIRFLFKHESLREVKTLVLDPPRDGAKLLCEKVNELKTVKDIFYISCDVPTLVRDCVSLKKQGFSPKEIQPLDMFPQSPHVESLVHLSQD